MNNMKNEISEISNFAPIKNEYVISIKYKGICADIYHSTKEQQFYTFLDGKKIEFGVLNNNYEEDLKYIIDEKLDLITTFPDFKNINGLSLRWFDNNGHRDIKLQYKGRILTVIIVTEEDKDNINEKKIENIIKMMSKTITMLVEKNVIQTTN